MSTEVLRNIQVEDPDDAGKTLGEVDRIEEGVLWEEKTAVFAADPERWVQRHIVRKFESYLRIRQALKGYADAAIGFDFQSEPQEELKQAVERAVQDLRRLHSEVTIHLRFGHKQ